uniref:Variant surface glycoprotein 1125.1101 n=1 Tax=Trypanosoma brucei TaxID=5691 RepID=A0A1J0R691_9TRYP|nr:variant surface glycoprotein 1125.1101 [Trypanosoma brucei]
MQTQKEAGKRWSQTLKAFFLFALAFRTAEQATDTAAVKGFCTETWYIEKLKETLQLRAQAAARAALAASEEARMLNLASTRHAISPKGAGYNALSVLATNRATALAKKIPPYLHLIDTALVLLAEKHGALKYMEALQNDNLPKGTADTVTNSAPNLLASENAKTCSVTQQITFKMTKDCANERNDKAKAEAEASNVEGWSHILVRSTSQVTKLAITTVGGTKGNAVDLSGTVNSVTDGPGCGGNGVAAGIGSHTNAIGISAKSISNKYATANIQVQPGDSHSGVQQQADPGSEHKIQLITADDSLRHALLAAVAEPMPSTKKVSTETLATLLSNPTMNKLLEAMAATQGKKSEKQLTDDDKATLLFGTRNADIQAFYIKNLEQDEITISSEPEIKGTTKKLSENNFADAMGYFYGQNMKKKTANTAETKPEAGGEKADAEDKTGENKDGDNKATAAECAATEEKNCDKNKCTCDKEKSVCKV